MAGSISKTEYYIKYLPAFFYIVTILVSLVPQPVWSAEEEYAVKAVFIERMIRFIDWPNRGEKGEDPDNRLLCLIGENLFGTHLESVANFDPERKPLLQIKYIGKKQQVDGCHILFISRSEAREVESILKQTRVSNVLTIGDTQGFAEKGVMLNMYIENEQLRFEINQAAVKRSGLKMSFKLLRLARIIN